MHRRLEGNLSKRSLHSAIVGVFIFLSTSIFQIFTSEHTLKKKQNDFLKTRIIDENSNNICQRSKLLAACPTNPELLDEPNLLGRQ